MTPTQADRVEPQEAGIPSEGNHSAVVRVSAVAAGALIPQVYGGEWCLDPAVEFRADLIKVLAALSTREAEAPVSDQLANNPGALPPVSEAGAWLIAWRFRADVGVAHPGGRFTLPHPPPRHGSR